MIGHASLLIQAAGTNILTDPVWSDANRELALENGILAAWSQPILTKDGEMLGTFALYASEPRSYRDLPVRLAESGTVYRWEKSGVEVA